MFLPSLIADNTEYKSPLCMSIESLQQMGFLNDGGNVKVDENGENVFDDPEKESVPILDFFGAPEKEEDRGASHQF